MPDLLAVAPRTAPGARPNRRTGWRAGARCRGPSSSGSTPIQIVGTPAATVTFSLSISSASAAGVRSGPGITRLAPTATPAWARPQALAWNIGTTGMIVSGSQAPMLSAVVDRRSSADQVERCE